MLLGKFDSLAAQIRLFANSVSATRDEEEFEVFVSADPFDTVGKAGVDEVLVGDLLRFSTLTAGVDRIQG